MSDNRRMTNIRFAVDAYDGDMARRKCSKHSRTKYGQILSQFIDHLGRTKEGVRRKLNIDRQREYHHRSLRLQIEEKKNEPSLAELRWAIGEDGTWVGPSSSWKPSPHNDPFEECTNGTCVEVRKNAHDWEYIIEEYPFTAAPAGVEISL